MSRARDLLPGSSRGLVFLAILTAAVGIGLLGEQGVRLGSWSFPYLDRSFIWGPAALAFFLVPHQARGRPSLRIVLVLAALFMAGWPLLAWRRSIVVPEPSLSVAVSRASDATGRAEHRVTLDSLEIESRRHLNRLAGRRRDIALEITGFLRAPHTGHYRFHLDCDDGCRIQINDNRLTPLTASASVETHLASGIHRLLILYRQAGGPAQLNLSWDQPRLIELLPLSHYVSGQPGLLSAARLRRREILSALSFFFCLAWWFVVWGLVLKIGESRAAWRQALTSGPSARRAPTAVAATLILYGALLRFDALLVRSRLAMESSRAETIHRWLRPVLPNYWALNKGNAPDDPYRADVRSYLDHAARMTPSNFYQASFREPFYVALVRLSVLLSGGRQVGILVQSFFFSVATLLLIYLLGWHLEGRWWANAALLPVVVHEWLVLEAPTGYRMSAYSFLLISFTGWVFLRHKGLWWVDATVAGVLAATVCLTRLSGLSFVLPLFLLRARSPGGREGVRYALTGFLVLTVLIAPFMLNCYLEHGDPFYSVSFHTRFWLDAEKTPGGPDGSVSLYRYLTEFHDLGTLAGGTLKGLTSLPLRTFWNGLAHFPLLSAVVVGGGVAGLLFGLAGPYRYLSLAYFGHLLPFAYIQNFPSGTMPRFAMPAYFFLVLAAILIGRRIDDRVHRKQAITTQA